jgi:ABC-type antimicrobial peptide transport system permease subunit
MVLARERMTTALATFLGALAILLAAVGIYGVTWNAVARRTPELGVRMALGAPPRGIAALVVKGVLQQVAVGVAAGIPLSLWSAKWIVTLMAGVDPQDPEVLAVAAATLAISAVAAAARPALRAAKLGPLRAIRSE